MTDARAAVDVVGTNDDAGELLCDVVVLVGGAGRAEHRDAVRAVPLELEHSYEKTCDDLSIR